MEAGRGASRGLTVGCFPPPWLLIEMCSWLLAETGLIWLDSSRSTESKSEKSVLFCEAVFGSRPKISRHLRFRASGLSHSPEIHLRTSDVMAPYLNC